MTIEYEADGNACGDMDENYTSDIESEFGDMDRDYTSDIESENETQISKIDIKPYDINEKISDYLGISDCIELKKNEEPFTLNTKSVNMTRNNRIEYISMKPSISPFISKYKTVFTLPSIASE